MLPRGQPSPLEPTGQGGDDAIVKARTTWLKARRGVVSTSRHCAARPPRQPPLRCRQGGRVSAPTNAHGTQRRPQLPCTRLGRSFLVQNSEVADLLEHQAAYGLSICSSAPFKPEGGCTHIQARTWVHTYSSQTRGAGI